MSYAWDFSFLPNYGGVLLKALGATFKLAVICLAAGLVLGCGFAAARTSKYIIPRLLAGAYVELFRNLPAIVLLFWFFYTIPLVTGIGNDRFVTAAIAFSLYSGAYFTEIIRSGIEAVDPGQWQAARALGFKPVALFRDIILPQAIKKMIPALANESIEVVKLTTVAATVAYPELLYTAKLLSDTEYRPVEAYTTVAGVLLIILLPMTLLLFRLERGMRRSG